MNPIEAMWFRNRLDEYVKNGATVINLGSSTRAYRRRVKPHIHNHLFGPLAARGVTCLHVDLKDDEGVDLVGDVTYPGFVEQLRQYQPAGIMCNNLLEHIEDRSTFCKAILDILPSDAFVFASVPRQYPLHADPIDTMFRPDVEELAAQFPGTTLVEGEVLECGNHRDRERYYRRATPRLWLVGRVKCTVRRFMPFYKPHQWLTLVWGRNRVDPDTPILVTCVVLRRVDSESALAPRWGRDQVKNDIRDPGYPRDRVQLSQGQAANDTALKNAAANHKGTLCNV